MKVEKFGESSLADAIQLKEEVKLALIVTIVSEGYQSI